VELSYLSAEEQRSLLKQWSATPRLPTPGHQDAELSQEGRLTPEVIESIMTEEKPPKREALCVNGAFPEADSEPRSAETGRGYSP
jgi:hypothetical protein